MLKILLSFYLLGLLTNPANATSPGDQNPSARGHDIGGCRDVLHNTDDPPQKKMPLVDSTNFNRLDQGFLNYDHAEWSSKITAIIEILKSYTVPITTTLNALESEVYEAQKDRTNSQNADLMSNLNQLKSLIRKAKAASFEYNKSLLYDTSRANLERSATLTPRILLLLKDPAFAEQVAQLIIAVFNDPEVQFTMGHLTSPMGLKYYVDSLRKNLQLGQNDEDQRRSLQHALDLLLAHPQINSIITPHDEAPTARPQQDGTVGQPVSPPQSFVTRAKEWMQRLRQRFLPRARRTNDSPANVAETHQLETSSRTQKYIIEFNGVKITVEFDPLSQLLSLKSKFKTTVFSLADVLANAIPDISKMPLDQALKELHDISGFPGFPQINNIYIATPDPVNASDLDKGPSLIILDHPFFRVLLYPDGQIVPQNVWKQYCKDSRRFSVIPGGSLSFELSSDGESTTLMLEGGPWSEQLREHITVEIGQGRSGIEDLNENSIQQIRADYGTLEISEGTDLNEIKAAYRRLAQRWHPDKNPDDPTASEKFQAIKAAYERLVVLSKSNNQ